MNTQELYNVTDVIGQLIPALTKIFYGLSLMGLLIVIFCIVMMVCQNMTWNRLERLIDLIEIQNARIIPSTKDTLLKYVPIMSKGVEPNESLDRLINTCKQIDINDSLMKFDRSADSNVWADYHVRAIQNTMYKRESRLDILISASVCLIGDNYIYEMLYKLSNKVGIYITLLVDVDDINSYENFNCDDIATYRSIPFKAVIHKTDNIVISDLEKYDVIIMPNTGVRSAYVMLNAIVQKLGALNN